MNFNDAQYRKWLSELKLRVRSAQAKAAIAVNSVLIGFYWELGKMITEKENIWGSKLIDQVAKDLKKEFPEMKGLSRSNLFYCKQFYFFYKNELLQQFVGHSDSGTDSFQRGTDTSNEIVQQPVGQIIQLVSKIPWGHNILIFSKSKGIDEASFYIQQTISNNWSRDVLALQIKTDLFKRSGKAVSNFSKTLPEPQSELAQQTLKDPYIFDFMNLAFGAREKEIEGQLIEHITKFLLELGKGFAFVSRQYRLAIADNEYYIDLLFYHTRLKCYVVIELKNTKFIPEYAGKLNFYLSAVDSLVKQQDDNPTIGILLCREKNNIEVEFALRDLGKPMGVSEFTIAENLPEHFKSSLPTIEEIEGELNNI